MCGHYGLDASVGQELHAVDTGLAVPAGTLVAGDVVLVDAVVYDVPLVLAGNLQYAVVGRTVDLLLGALDEDDGLVGYLDGAEGRGGGAVGYVVVGRTGVVDTPEEVVQAVALEYVGGLAEGVVAQGAALGCHQGDATLLEADHVVVEFGAGHVAVAPVEVADAGVGVGEDVDVDLLTVVLTLRTEVYEGLAQCVGVGTFGVVGYGYADGLTLLTACIAAEVEVVLVLVVDSFLYAGGCPGIAASPRGLLAHVEVDALEAPVYEVVR